MVKAQSFEHSADGIEQPVGQFMGWYEGCEGHTVVVMRGKRMDLGFGASHSEILVVDDASHNQSQADVGGGYDGFAHNG